MHLMDTALPIRPGEHACCRLAHTPDRERLARAFVRAGLERGDKVLYSSDREDLDELRARLTGDDETLAAALDTGRLSVRRAADVYTPDGRFDARRMIDSVRDEHAEALAAGYRGLSMTGEMGWAAGGDRPAPSRATTLTRAGRRHARGCAGLAAGGASAGPPRPR